MNMLGKRPLLNKAPLRFARSGRLPEKEHTLWQAFSVKIPT